MPTLLTPEAGGSAALRRRKAAAPTNYDAGWCCPASSSRLGLSDAGGRCAVAASASLVSMSLISASRPRTCDTVVLDRACTAAASVLLLSLMPPVYSTTSHGGVHCVAAPNSEGDLLEAAILPPADPSLVSPLSLCCVHAEVQAATKLVYWAIADPCTNKPSSRNTVCVCVFKAPRTRHPGPRCVGDPARVHSSGKRHFSGRWSGWAWVRNPQKSPVGFGES